MKHARADYKRFGPDPALKDPALAQGHTPIAEDEPVFLLRAKDPVAAATVRYWIRETRKLLTRDLPPAERAAAKKSLALAEAHSYAMEDWPTKNKIATA